MTILTIEQLSDVIKMPKSSIYSMTRARARARMESPLPVLRINGNLRFCLESVQEWLKKLEDK